MLGPQVQESLEITGWLGTTPNAEKIDQLDEEARSSPARFLHDATQLAKPGNETVVTDTQERPTRDVAHSSRLDDDRTGLPFGEAAVPSEHVGRHHAGSGRPPRNHRWHPRPFGEFETTCEPQRREHPRCERLLDTRGPEHREPVSNSLGGLVAAHRSGWYNPTV